MKPRSCPAWLPPFWAAATVGVATPATAAVPSSDYVHRHDLVAVAAGRHLNLFCLGHGQPTVLFEAGFGSTTMAWRRVQGAVAEDTRACAYDRAGYGFSDPATRPSDARDSVDDLHQLIEAALPKPVILVGHSMGGLYALLYAETYPGDVAGLVLVDPHFPEFERQFGRTQTVTVAAAQKKASDEMISMLKDCLSAARNGSFSEPAMQSSPCLMADGPLDPVLSSEWHRQASGVPYEAANLSEAESASPKDADGSSLDDDELPRVPIALRHVGISVLIEDPDHPPPEMASALRLERQEARVLAGASDNGSSELVPSSGHEIQTDRPDAVIRTVRAAVDAERSNAAAERNRRAR